MGILLFVNFMDTSPRAVNMEDILYIAFLIFSFIKVQRLNQSN